MPSSSYKKLSKAAQGGNAPLLMKLVEEHGKVFSLTLPLIGKKLHFIADPIYIKDIFTRNPNNYARAKIAFKEIVDFLGHYGLLGLLDPEDFPMWKKDREILNPVFSKNKMVGHIHSMVQATTYQLNQIELNKPFLIDQALIEISLRNLLESLFGGAKIDTKPIPELARNILYLASAKISPFVKLLGVPMPLYYRYKKLKNQLQNIGTSLVQQCLSESATQNNFIRDLAKGYGCENYENLDEKLKQKLIDEAVTFLIAGHETVAGLMIHTNVSLSLYPLVRDKVANELKSLGDREISYDDLMNHLPYTTATVKETLRLWPPGTLLVRSANSDDVVNNDLHIKKGDIVAIATYVTQRLPEYWANPEGFDPERFMHPLDENLRWLYLPFGLGERACIGGQFALLQSILVTAMIVQRYQLDLFPPFMATLDSGMVNRLAPNILMTANAVNPFP